MKEDTLKIALLQQSFEGSREKTIQVTCERIKEASKQAHLVILQELHTTEYFCQSEDVKFFDYSSHFQEDLHIFSHIAKECSVVLVGSFFEQRAAGLYHNTAIVFEKDGSIAGKYRKMHIPDDPCFYEKFYFTPGDLGFEPIKTSVGVLGVLVCWDQWYPEAARLMALKGAQILIYPTAIGWFDEDAKEEKQRQLDAWITVQRGHAIANGIPVAACNRVGFEKDSSGVMQGIRFWGNSFVVGSQGEFLGQLGDQADILYANISLKRCEEVRRIWPFLRDRRIEHYEGLLKRYLD